MAGNEVYKVAFWMRKHKAMTWKRTWVWSTSPSIAELDLGPMLPHERVCDVQTTVQWKDGSGRKRFQGNANLKTTQYLANQDLVPVG